MQHSTDSRKPSQGLWRVEVYGDTDAPETVAMANGGAGATGLLRVLANTYLTSHDRSELAIGWHQQISGDALAALARHDVAIALTYDPAAEQQALRQQQASARGLLFYDRLMLVGPRANPADIASNEDVIVAMQKVAAQYASSFLSRDDGSGSNVRERDLWRTAGVRPWRATDGCPYVTETMLPRDALLEADRRGAYALTDHGTWISTRDRLRHTRPYGQPNARMVHPCHALLQTQPSAAARDLYEFLFSPTAWQVLKSYGRQEFGEALFEPAFEPGG